MDIKKLLDGLFNKKEPANYNVPVHSEVISRNTKDKWDYAEWLRLGKQEPYLKLLKDNYELRKEGVEGTIDLQLFHSRAANGFYFGYNSVFQGKVFSFLFDYLKDRVEEMGYICKNNQRKFRETGDKVKLTEMYYLKPPRPKEAPNGIDQMYGNVHLELVSFDEKPEYIKCMVNVYSDRQFKEPRSFDEFTEVLFSPNTN